MSSSFLTSFFRPLTQLTSQELLLKTYLYLEEQIPLVKVMS
jgi:hypothetical protein